MISLAKNIMRNMYNSNNRLSVLGMQLASGNRLVNAGVDAAGLAISVKMQSQIRGLEMARRNTQDAMSMLYTADGALSNVNDALIRIKELTVQAANGTNTSSDIENIQKEISELLDFIGATGKDTEFNRNTLFDGSKETSGLWIQTGANSGQGLYINFSEISLDKLGLKDFDVSNPPAGGITDMISMVDSAIEYINSERGSIGAKINRLEYTTSGIDSMTENLSDAYSRIADTDMAKAMMEYTKEQLKLQVSTTMLSNLFTQEQQMVSMLLSSLR